MMSLGKTRLKIRKDPYHLGEDIFCFLNISGGRTSAFMLRKILDRYEGKLPENAEAVFMNTGKEHPATLDFLKETSEAWGIEITWLEFDYDPEGKGTAKSPKYIHRKVDFETASRKGEPFEKIITRKKQPPGVFQRYCTTELKVRTLERYAKREKGLEKWCNVIGIRADEPKRIREVFLNPKCAIYYPLALAGVTRQDVFRFWDAQPFDLKINGEWSNCDLCFLKGRKQRLRLIAEHPESADWWIRQEERTEGWFEKDVRYKDLLNAPPQLDLFLEAEEKIDCYCGD